MRKKILIFGPIGDYGGRDVEVNIIARALSDYDVKICSTKLITDQSYALRGLTIPFTCLPKELYRRHLIRTIATTLSVLRGKTESGYAHIKNRISRKLFNFPKLEVSIIKREIDKVDLVIGCVQLSSKHLAEVAKLCYERKIPLIVRTTGTIRRLSFENKAFLPLITHFVHHSEANAMNLDCQFKGCYSIIDQCTIHEDALLALPDSQRGNVTFGYLGRLSDEKGVKELVGIFKKWTGYKLIIAGGGKELSELEALIGRGYTDIICEGHIDQSRLPDFFARIDVLIIPSFEESGPLVGLEAMAAAKVIVSTKVGAMPERLKNTDNQFWIDINDCVGTISTLKLVAGLSRTSRTKIGNELRLRYLRKYSQGAINSEYQRLIQNFT